MFDKKAYQRELMRKRRADAKAATSADEAKAEQQAAHVGAWLAGLDSFARLDYRAELRRALTPVRKPIVAADLARAGV